MRLALFSALVAVGCGHTARPDDASAASDLLPLGDGAGTSGLDGASQDDSALDEGVLIEGFEEADALGGWTIDNATYGTLVLGAGTDANAFARADAGHGAVLSFDFPPSTFTSGAPGQPYGYTGTSCAQYGMAGTSGYASLPCVAAMKQVDALYARSIEVWIEQRTPGIDVALRIVDSTGNYYDYDLDTPILAIDGWQRYVVDLARPAWVTKEAKQGPHRGAMQPPSHPMAAPTFTQPSGAASIAQLGMLIMPIHEGWNIDASTYSVTTGSITFDDLRIADAATSDGALVRTVDVLAAPARLPPTCNGTTCVTDYLSSVGINAHQGTADPASYAALIADVKDMNLTSVRGNDAWVFAESTKGTYSTGLGFYSAIVKANLRALLTLLYDNPLYDANQLKKSGCSDGVDDAPNGPATQGFLGYTNAMVAAWGTASVDWEVWNEPNASYAWNAPTSTTCVGYGDDGTYYPALLVAAADQIRKTASTSSLPTPTIAAAGLGGAQDFRLLKAIIAKEASSGTVTQSITIHPYIGDDNFQYPEEQLSSYAYLAYLLAQQLSTAKMWSTEFGFSSSDFDAYGNYVHYSLATPYTGDVTGAKNAIAHTGTDGQGKGGRELQAVFTVRAMLSHILAGITHDFIYQLSDAGSAATMTDLVVPVSMDATKAVTRVSRENNFGLVEGQYDYFTTTPLGKKPAYYAVKGLTSFLAGKTIDGVVDCAMTGLDVLRLHDAQHQYVIAWAEHADASYRLYVPRLPSVQGACWASGVALDGCTGNAPPTSTGTDSNGAYVIIDRHPLYLTF